MGWRRLILVRFQNQVPRRYIFRFSVSDAISSTPSSLGYEVTPAKYAGFSPLAKLTSSHQACCIDFWGKVVLNCSSFVNLRLVTRQQDDPTLLNPLNLPHNPKHTHAYTHAHMHTTHMLNYTLDTVPKMQSESTFPPSNVRYERMLVTNMFQHMQTSNQCWKAKHVFIEGIKLLNLKFLDETLFLKKTFLFKIS